MRNLLVALLALSGAAQAHDARPLSITLVEQTQGVYRAIVRVPPTLTTGQIPIVHWPTGCTTDGDAAPTALPGSPNMLFIACPGGLANQTVGIEYPLYNPSISSILRLETLSGTSITTVLPPDETQWRIPPEPTWLSVAMDYARLGFLHIWEGPDHLLFVAGLLVLAALPRRVVWAVTGFTAAHSITLSLAALGFVHIPIAPTEALIALSIVFVAAEIARSDSNSLSRRYPVALSFIFGLLHGLGFASALGEIGLPQNALATGLLSFNIGVELGQLAFIAAAAAGWYLLRRALPSDRRSKGYAPGAGMVALSAYALGVPASFWFIERSIFAFQ